MDGTKGQKQERMSCGEIFAVSGFHTQGYCIISPHQAAFYIMCYSLLTTNTSSCNLVGLPTFQHKSQKPIGGFLWLFLWHDCFALEIRFEMEIGVSLQPRWMEWRDISFSFIFISYNLLHHFFLLFIMKNNLLSFYICECAPAVNMRSVARCN